jgi:hypothetical protein
MSQPPNKQSPQLTNRLPLRQKGGSLVGVLAALLIVFAGITAITLNRQNMYDWARLRGYQAPTTIAALADQTTMTSRGRHIFYVNHPVVDEKTAFKSVCPSATKEQSIVLGCYIGDQRGIYLLAVDDPRLTGVEQVTAAHEMLHAAYDRLSSNERKRVDTMLLDYYDHQLADARIKTTIDAYRKTEPNDLVNEMHSIFGSEIGILPSGLEEYYTQYFSDRQAVVAYANKYQAEFTTRRLQVAAYDTELGRLKEEVSNLQTSLEKQKITIENRQRHLDTLRSSDVAGYNAAVPGYNSLVDSYNNDVGRLRSLIDRYNSIVVARNAISTEATQLTNELSTDVAPIK